MCSAGRHRQDNGRQWQYEHLDQNLARCHPRLLASAGRQMVITTLASSPCAAILILAGGGYRAGGAVQIGGDGGRPPQSCNMNGNSPAETGRLVLRLGSFRLLAPDPSTTNYCHQKLHKRKTCASLQPIHPSLARRFIKKVMPMAIGRRTVGCRLHLPNWDAKYGGRTPLSGSLNKRPFWIFM